MIQDFGKSIIILGIILIIAGILVSNSDKLPFIGKLPGDILVKRDNFTFYAPLATSILISLILTLLFWILSGFRK